MPSVVAAVLLVVAASADCARILGLFPAPSRDHHDVYGPLMVELAKRGHQVTVYSPFVPENPPENYDAVRVDVCPGNGDADATFARRTEAPFETMVALWRHGSASCDQFLRQKAVRRLIDSTEEFDLLVMSNLFTECLLAFAHKFDAPAVHVCPYDAGQQVLNAIGNPLPFASLPSVFLGYPLEMTLTQRLVNSLFGVFVFIGNAVYHLPHQNAVVTERFGNVPTVSDLQQERTALVLWNSHHVLSHPIPLLPGVVEVGGLHVQQRGALPKDVKSFLDAATDGAVFVKLSTSEAAPVVAELSGGPHRVLWQREQAVELTEELPETVKVVGAGVAVDDVLGHPSVRLMVSNGAPLLHMAAAWWGVPVAVASNPDTVRDALTDAARQQADALSHVLHDQPQPPLRRAIFWIEHVLRHDGAPHMRSPARKLSWYQRHMLDILAVLAAPFLLYAVVIRSRPTRGNRKTSKKRQ